MKVDIVIPFYNEEKNLIILCKELNRAIKSLKHKYRIIFVDDGSTDSSYKIVFNSIKNIKFKILKKKNKSGQASAFKSAFKILKSDYTIRMDSDLQDDPKDLIKFDKKLHKNFDIILGYRNKRKHGIALKLSTEIFNYLIKIFGFSNLKSSSGSFICFKSKFLKDLNLKKNDHRYLTIIAQRKGAKKNIVININHRKRIFGKSNYNTLKKIILGFFEVLNFLFRLRKYSEKS
tara:strand:- start:4958 stop:5653 length:696 start_codon:yes stop_codon:yes gene_type:complete